MLLQFALVLAMLLQVFAAGISIKLTRVTKYNVSWMLISAGFIIMAVRMLVEFLTTISDFAPQTFREVFVWLGVAVSFFFAVGVFLIQKIFKYMKKVEQEKSDMEKILLNAIIQAEETEKKRFAKDLHDGLGPLLSTVKMSLSALGPKMSDPVGREILANTSHIVNEALSTIKEVSNNLSPHVLANLGVASAISTFAAKVNMTRTVTVEFRTNMEGERFDTDKEVVLYRAACELINNGMKHSGASKIEMDLHRHQKIITLQYLDNGRGFDTASLSSEEPVGMGIPNIETRVR